MIDCVAFEKPARFATPPAFGLPFVAARCVYSRQNVAVQNER
ncbi:hypothetical protein CP97_14625 [Aurantiacibacter atlanticus]|uniref:Uncharacterized protein n=1 Tax=Aurantiacibacter atlanticus TaxID=1648404 RepID=A0A161I415_9SPHN|nr:hypothetical protein CP97_14625 [Aurantiacibacter atlanticus]